MEKFLVVVDMQNDFINGSLGTAEAQSIVPRVQQRIEDALAEERTPIFTQDTHEANYMETNEGKHLPVPHCVEGTNGWEINSTLTPFANQTLRKPTFGCLALVDYLSDVSKNNGANLDIALCGVCTDICVVSNALLLRAHYPEASISVFADSCAATTPQRHEAALDVMRSCQIEVL